MLKGFFVCQIFSPQNRQTKNSIKVVFEHQHLALYSRERLSETQRSS
ncbi:hypothetical protein VIBHAR_06130 [Vibrio campbellii ATCC BAA-1116]|uniref:Uncharacterized protein n=1 Tax=Vibrio campbellii (strain ATCC BAA-1116) TaxID=2902295 RepID=A7N765_VIBC1|nr:hypothetical protein VIBHAR_06130 [Vibrio campbellii ATCC BAA-1116]